jgi:hypothetical protein
LKGDENATGLQRLPICLCTGREANCVVARGKALTSDLRANMMIDGGMEERQFVDDAHEGASPTPENVQKKKQGT